MDDSILLIIPFLAAGTVVLLLLGAQKLATQKREKLQQRVAVVAVKEEALAAAEARKEKPSLLNVSGLLSRIAGPDFMRKQSELLASADVPWRPSEFLTMRLTFAAVAVLGGMVTVERVDVVVLLGAALFWAPVFYVKRCKSRRQAKFDMQLPDALQLIVNSLRAGFSFNKALEVAAQSSTPPISTDFSSVLREISLGMSAEDALQGMARRAQSPEFDIVISAYLIQREVGGNLAVIMEKVADTVRQRLRMRGELKVLTAQGRISGYIVGLLPFAVFVIVTMAAPGYLDPLVKSSLGQFVLGFAVVWQLLGMLWIRSVINIRM